MMGGCNTVRQGEILDYMYQNMQDTPRMKRNRIVTISLITVCQGFQMIPLTGIALFLPLIRKDLGLSFTQGGTLSAVTILVYALMQIPAGYLTDRFGSKRLFFIGVLGTSILCFTFGLVSSYWQALANQILFGFFSALIFMPGLVLLTKWFPPDRRATAMGISLIGALWGSVVLSIVGPLLVTDFSWRFPFLSFAPAGIIASFVFLRFGEEPPPTGGQRKITMREMIQPFRYRFMWVCGILQYIRLAVVQGIAFWLPSFLVYEKGLSLQVAGILLAVRFGLIAPSNILGGYVSDRLRNPTLVIGFALIILAITTGLFIVVNNIIILIVVICINAFFVQMYFGPLFAIPIDILGTRTAGTSGGFSNLFANIGAFSFIYLLGILKDTTGSFDFGFYAIAGVCFIGLVFTILLAQMRHKVTVPTTQ